MATLDLSDPRILGTYNEIRNANSATNWMVISLLPRLPGDGQSADVASVLASGTGDWHELQSLLGQDGIATYGYLKRENKYYVVECVPEKPNQINYGKQVATFLKEHDGIISISSPQELEDTMTGMSKVNSQASSSMLPGKGMGMSTSSLSSDKGEDAHEEAANRIREHALMKQKLKEEGERKLKAIAEARAKDQQWMKEKQKKEEEIKEAYKAQYETMENRNRKGAILSNWLDQLTSDGRFWKKRWMVVHGNHLHLYKDHVDTKPISTIELRGAVVTDAKNDWYLPDTLAVRGSDGLEYVLHTLSREDYLRTVAAVERVSTNKM